MVYHWLGPGHSHEDSSMEIFQDQSLEYVWKLHFQKYNFIYKDQTS